MPERTQIPFAELVEGIWYVGRGRNANVGFYEDGHFSVICDSLLYNGSFATPQATRPGCKAEPYFYPEHGCFQPFLALSSLALLTEECETLSEPELIIGRFYVGEGEGLKVARWEGNRFSLLKKHYVSDSVYHYDIEARDYGEGAPFFRPLLEINEGEVVVPMAEANYARVLRL